MLSLFKIDPRVKKGIDDLLEEPVIVRVEKFDSEGAQKFLEQMNDAHKTGQPIIPIVIDSYGGQVYSLNHMIDIIKMSKLPVATVALGKAMSCGAILFTFGQQGMRWIAPHARLMIHDVSSFSAGKTEEVKADAAHLEELNVEVYQMMAANAGKPKNYFWKMVHKRGRADWFIGASEAVEHNLANHIGIPTFTTTVTVKTELA